MRRTLTNEKPCPVCGLKDPELLFYRSFGRGNPPDWYVFAVRCHDPDCLLGPLHPTEEEARDVWRRISVWQKT
jgi:hypothetical protein